jgi:hypothetical protein
MNKQESQVFHYVQEMEQWQVTIKTLQQENNSLKDRLSETIRQKLRFPFVEEAEYFQQIFIEKDQVINLLRHDMISLLNKLSLDGNTNAYEQEFLLLEKDLEKFVLEFQRMKTSFANFLLAK